MQTDAATVKRRMMLSLSRYPPLDPKPRAAAYRRDYGVRVHKDLSLRMSVVGRIGANDCYWDDASFFLPGGGSDNVGLT